MLKDPIFEEFYAWSEDFGLEAVWKVEEDAAVTPVRIRDFLKDKRMRIDPSSDDDRIVFYSAKKSYILELEDLPVLSLYRYLDAQLDLTPEGRETAIFELNKYGGPVKLISYDQANLYFSLFARHQEMRSLIDNFDYYLEQLDRWEDLWNEYVAEADMERQSRMPIAARLSN